MLGMHGTVYANYAINEADLLLAFGVRFDDRVTGKLEAFASRARIVHIDIDPAEINKNKQVGVNYLGGGVWVWWKRFVTSKDVLAPLMLRLHTPMREHTQSTQVLPSIHTPHTTYPTGAHHDVCRCQACTAAHQQGIGRTAPSK